MKKTLVLCFMILLSVIPAACDETTTTAPVTDPVTTASTATTADPDIALVDAVFAWLDLGDLTALTAASPRLIMAAFRDDVTITWDITNPECIAANGVISQPPHATGDVVVTLTATLTKGAVTRTKVFIATVVALPAPQDAEPIMRETFADYLDGNIRVQAGRWAPVSGKSGTSLFSVVSEVAGAAIPDGSKALEIKAFTETQIEAALDHDLDFVVVEVDLYQTANGSPLNIQSSSSSPVVAFGLSGGGSASADLYYRTDNGTMYETSIPLDTWITVRFEVDLTAKTIELFYYDAAGNLIPCTPGPVAYGRYIAMNALFIRSGSSTTMQLNENACYITNIVVNRIEALPRPEEDVKLGEVENIPVSVIIEHGTTFNPSVPTVYNFYGSRRILVENSDYALETVNPVDVFVDGDYIVNYTLTNLFDPSDVMVISQTVTVYSPLSPNVISDASSTSAAAITNLATVTVTVLRPEGTLHYAVGAATLTAEEIAAHADHVSVDITANEVVLFDLVVAEGESVWLVVELNGWSNVIQCIVSRQPIVMISTPEEFFTAVTSSTSSQVGKYYILANDLDFGGFIWTVTVTNAFVATLDGQGHSISNLIVDKTGVKGGIFSDLEGNATIMNIIFDNVHTTSDTAGSGLLCGEVRGSVTLDNIVVMNSSNVVSNQYGALLVGRIRSGSLTVSNISIYDVTMETKNNYGGGLVAGMEAGTSAFFSDIYANTFIVMEGSDVSATGKMLGGIIGRVLGDVTIERVVAFGIELTGKTNVGGLVGKFDSGAYNVIIRDIYLEGGITCPTDYRNVLGGNIASTNAPTVENAWASGFENMGINGLAILESHFVAVGVTTEEAWWTINVGNIATDDLWSFFGVGFVLVNFRSTQMPYHDIFIDFNMGAEDTTTPMQEGRIFAFDPPEVPGYSFVGWFIDAGLNTGLPADFVIAGPVTVYGQYETVPASTVTFVTGVEGVTVADQFINYGLTATLPIIPNTMIDLVLKTVTGWTLNGTPYDFATPVSEAITLVAVWDTVTYTVSINDEILIVSYGDLVTEPATDPLHPMFATLTFGAWQSEGIDYVFSTSVTTDLIITIRWIAPEWVDIATAAEFEYMATHASSFQYRLTADIDFSAYVWTATGVTFAGVLDGQNHVLSNLAFSSTGVKGGIFGVIDNGVVRNLVFDNVDLVADTSFVCHPGRGNKGNGDD